MSPQVEPPAAPPAAPAAPPARLLSESAVDGLGAAGGLGAGAAPPREPLPAEVDPDPAVVLPWLIRLRWVAVGGQALTVLLVRALLGADLPLAGLAATIAVAALTNVGLVLGARRLAPDPRVLPAVLTLDTVLLTALLAQTGGPRNPFAMLYVVHVAMAAVVLSRRWTVWMGALSTLAYGALFVVHVPLRVAGAELPEGTYRAGAWCALALVSAVTAAVIERVSEALRRRDRLLARVRAVAERNERLASLTTLAAGAAHELGTPLGTIAVVARELERALERLPAEDERRAALVEDARLVRAEVDRCRAILDRMGAQAARVRGSVPEPVALGELLALVRAEVPPAQAPGVRLADPTAAGEVVRAHRLDLVQALQPLVTNALDATGGQGPVTLALERAPGPGPVRLVVRDHGHGMAPDVLARVSEPFFTTKPPGRGTGLGLYLVRLLAERLGGRLALASRPGEGTTATLELPALDLDGLAGAAPVGAAPAGAGAPA